jgi:hypothetical protein
VLRVWAAGATGWDVSDMGSLLRVGSQLEDLNEMRRSGWPGDHGRAERSVIARIGRALWTLREVRPGSGPYLRRLAECDWSEGAPPSESRRQRCYRHRCGSVPGPNRSTCRTVLVL